MKVFFVLLAVFILAEVIYLNDLSLLIYTIVMVGFPAIVIKLLLPKQ